MKTVTLGNKNFKEYISSEEIQKRIKEMGAEISKDLKGKNPIFIGVMNGSFRFASDLFSHIDLDCSIDFVKLSSYRGTSSSGQISEGAVLKSDITDKTVVILEDIVDTGNTLEFLMTRFSQLNAREVRIASLLFKPGAYLGSVELDYVGFAIPNLFVVGYGLDYDEMGRNLNEIYQITT
jgi:hypoxanthine phosphoribosyltransferase